jgi:hypothetical protein
MDIAYVGLQLVLGSHFQGVHRFASWFLPLQSIGHILQTEVQTIDGSLCPRRQEVYLAS